MTLFLGDELEVTAEMIELARDRDGVSWLETEDSRFGFGEAPADIKQQRWAIDKQRIEEELMFLRRNNPSLVRKAGAAARMDQLNEALSHGYGD